jgi:chitinase
MTYDYHGTWDAATGLNSPLYGRGEVEYPNSTKPIENWKNANYSINYWISNGCPPEKINFGLAAYGRSFTLQNTTLNKVGAPVIKGGLAGAYTKEEGIYSYFEICEKINVENWKKYWDEKQQSVYATIDDQWVGYDNQRSIQLKVKWASSMQLGGTMLWTLDFDDYTGQFCNQGTFPIANAIKAVFDEFAPPVINTTLKIPSKNETEGQLTQNDGSNSMAPVVSSTKHYNTTHKPSVSIKPEIVNGVHVDPSLSVTGISASFNNKSLTSSSSITDPKKNSAIGCSKASYFLINLFYLVLSLFIV